MAKSVVVCVLAALFGISSWIEINGLWVELPLLIPSLPESGNLASFIVVITQLANIGPIIYSIVRKRWLKKERDKYLIHGTLFVGTTSCLLLIFFWSKTSMVGSTSYSVPFLVLTFFLAFVDCTSSVLYLPFMSNFKQSYLVPFLIGEGLSGLIPAVVALVQGVGGNPQCRNVTDSYDNATGPFNYTVVPVYSPPRFSVETFFIFLTAMLVVSWTSFVLLNTLSVAIREQVPDAVATSPMVQNSSLAPSRSKEPLFHTDSSLVMSSQFNNNESSAADPVLRGKDISRRKYLSFLVLQGVICCFTNGVLPSLQTYSCLPYGNVAYHLSTTLANIANPLACMIALFNWTSRSDVVSALSLLGATSGAYIVATAILSPTPPLVGTTAGEALLIVFWIVFTGALSYVKACIASALRQYRNGRKSLFYYGVCTQTGSFVGAIVTFVILNYANIFVFYSPCQ